MKVLAGHNDHRFVIGNVLFGITPFAGKLDSGFICLCTAVHKQRFLITEQLTYIFFSYAKLIIVKCA